MLSHNAPITDVIYKSHTCSLLWILSLSEKRHLAEKCGLEEPLNQRFGSMAAPARLPELVFLLLVHAARGLPMSKSSGAMAFESRCSIDPVTFSTGLACVMRHMSAASIKVSYLTISSKIFGI